MLLRAADLPGDGWKQLDQRTWRTGEADPDSGWARGAREIGSISSWRSFEQDRPSRGLWCQVTPLESADDAAVALTDLPSKVLRNLRAEVEVIGSRDIEPPGISGAIRVLAHEQTTSGPQGEAGLVMFHTAQVDRCLSVLYAGGNAGAWDWPSVGALAAIQASRVEGFLGGKRRDE